jgi:L-ribulose-5-phosphate 3-epimerase
MELEMSISRREFVKVGGPAVLAGAFSTTISAAARLLAHAKANNARFRVGVTDWNLQQEAKLGAFAVAKRIGFEGLQVSLGHEPVGTLPLYDPERQRAYITESKRVGLPIASVCLEILHRHALKNDPLAQRWVAESISVATTLGVPVVLLPFFGKSALTTTMEMDYVADALKELAPMAEKHGVVLGLEDTLSAKDNVRLIERTKSPAVLTYYDIGNSTRNGFDILTEIRWLGRDRICEVHVKDNPHFLGEGAIDLGAVVRTLAEIGFEKWAHLETSSPTKSIEADMGRNLDFLRSRMREVL